MAKDRIVLDDAAWQFGLSSFILGLFFLLGMGLGLSIRWAGVTKFFDLTIIIIIIIIIIIYFKKKIGDQAIAPPSPKVATSLDELDPLTWP